MFDKQPVWYHCFRHLTTGMVGFAVPANEEPTEVQVSFAYGSVVECEEGRDMNPGPRGGTCPPECALKNLCKEKGLL